MRALEQQSLLLRQLAALRRGGKSQDEALAMAGEGLPAGPLSDRVVGARRRLAAGEETVGGTLDRLLGGGDTPIEALDHASAAIDAQLSADAGLVMVRLYVGLALAGPLLLGCVLAWLGSEVLLASDAIRDAGYALGAELMDLRLFDLAAGALKFAGVPLALLLLFVVHATSRRLAPGVGRLERAAALLERVAAGGDPAATLLGPVERYYFETRRTVVGAPQAATDLAEELVRDGEHALLLFRHIAPFLAAALAVVLMWPALVLVVLPMFRAVL